MRTMIAASLALVLATPVAGQSPQPPADPPEAGEQNKTEPWAARARRSAADYPAEAMEEARIVRHAVGRCWNPPADHRDDPTPAVALTLTIKPDGTLGGIADIVPNGASEEHERLTRSAMRAIRKCFPLEGLPLEEFGVYRRIRITFKGDRLVPRQKALAPFETMVAR